MKSTITKSITLCKGIHTLEFKTHGSESGIHVSGAGNKKSNFRIYHPQEEFKNSVHRIIIDLIKRKFQLKGQV